MKKTLFNVLLGILGAVVSYLLIIIDTLTFGGNIYAYVFLPFHIAVVLFVVFSRQPKTSELVLRVIAFFPIYILLIKLRPNFLIYDIVNNYGASYPEIHVAIISDLIVATITFYIASLVRLVFYAKEKSIEKMSKT